MDRNDPATPSDDIAISVRGLSKSYRLFNHPGDRIKQFFSLGLKQYHREFTALKDVSFDTKKGETVGIIGRNGSGKSTLLQLICGILKPTSGTVQVNGRVSALLELGAGFNPEFTGRENIYMNAAILGLTKAEVDARFDDIVAFADIDDFLDQPVNTYSSGMYVRLAFAVVVHVGADILIIDEALSVGDTFFQAKCITHLKNLMKSGVTVFFVSHDAGAVKALCSRAVYLDHGKVAAMGATDDVVEAYYGTSVRSSQAVQHSPQAVPEVAKHLSDHDLADQQAFVSRAKFHRLQNGKAKFLNVQLLDPSGHKLELVNFGQTVILRMTFQDHVGLPSVGLAYHIRDRNGFDVIYSDTGIESCHIDNLRVGEIVTMDWEFNVCLQEGSYTVAAMLSFPRNLSLGEVDVCDFVPLAANFQVVRGSSLPIYGAAYWKNTVSQRRFANELAEKK